MTIHSNRYDSPPDPTIALSADIELDEPGFYSVVRVSYLGGTVYEVRAAEGCDVTDYSAIFDLLPLGAAYLGSETVAPGTLGTDAEIVVRYLVTDGDIAGVPASDEGMAHMLDNALTERTTLGAKAARRCVWLAVAGATACGFVDSVESPFHLNPHLDFSTAAGAFGIIAAVSLQRLRRLRRRTERDA